MNFPDKLVNFSGADSVDEIQCFFEIGFEFDDFLDIVRDIFFW